MNTPQPRADVCRILGLPVLRMHTGAEYSTVSLDQYKSAIRVRIAELEGWYRITNPKRIKEMSPYLWDNDDGRGPLKELTDYPNDLNAPHEWIVAMPDESYWKWRKILDGIIRDRERTALECCEARILMEGK